MLIPPPSVATRFPSILCRKCLTPLEKVKMLESKTVQQETSSPLLLEYASGKSRGKPPHSKKKPRCFPRHAGSSITLSTDLKVGHYGREGKMPA
jgi:hypothetical protein